jgi:hypothetical protein
MLVTLAAGLLAVGALSVTFADRVAGQSASPPASATSVSSASPPASATSEDFTILSTPIEGSGCDKNANNPHIATSDGPRRAKGFGEIVKYCNTRKDHLWVRTQLWKKGNNGDTTWANVDEDFRECFTCWHTGIGAEKNCANRNDNLFQTVARVGVYHNGQVYADTGESRIVTLNCGGF